MKPTLTTLSIALLPAAVLAACAERSLATATAPAATAGCRHAAGTATLQALAKASEARRDQAQAQRQAVAQALRIAGRRTREGHASALGERLAERNVLGVEQGVVSLQSGLLQTQVALFRALGGGWSGVSP